MQLECIALVTTMPFRKKCSSRQENAKNTATIHCRCHVRKPYVSSSYYGNWAGLTSLHMLPPQTTNINIVKKLMLEGGIRPKIAEMFSGYHNSTKLC